MIRTINISIGEPPRALPPLENLKNVNYLYNGGLNLIRDVEGAYRQTAGGSAAFGEFL